MNFPIRLGLALVLVLISSECLHASLSKQKKANKWAYGKIIRRAVRRNDLAFIKEDLKDRDPNQEVDPLTGSILHEAAWMGKLEIVKFLVAHPKIKLNIQDRRGVTPLMCAVRGKHVEVVSYLIDIHKKDGKDIGLNLSSEPEGTALHSASTLYNFFSPWREKEKEPKIKILKLLISCPHIETDAIWYETTNFKKRTPLHMAAWSGFKQAIELLIEVYKKQHKDIGLYKKDNHGQTPHSIALAGYKDDNKNMYLEIANLLSSLNRERKNKRKLLNNELKNECPICLLDYNEKEHRKIGFGCCKKIQSFCSSCYSTMKRCPFCHTNFVV